MRRALLLTVGCTLASPAVASAGTIRGVVTFKGTPPARAKLRRDSDPYCDKTPQLADDVIVTGGKVRDVIVRVKNGTAGKHAAPAAPVTIEQKACTYSPHVIGAIAGQKLVVANGDATYHNVHGWLGTRTLWNDSHPAGSPTITKDDVGKPGDVLELRCDVHAWMHAYVVVHDHPFFAVTGDDGAFQLTGLSPGTYTIEAWHPVLGLRTARVVVGKGKKATATKGFVFEPPAAPKDD